MSQKKQLPILEFSRLTGITRDNLRFYDRIDLLKPEMRGENGYRYYARRQLSSGYLISSLRLLGVGLEDIKRYSADRTPEHMLALFNRQEAYIQEEIAKLREISEIMALYAHMAREAMAHGDGELQLEERKRERIFLCPPAPGEASEEDAGILAYEYANGQGINLGYPIGVLVTRDPDGADGAWGRSFYFKAGKGGNAWKPAGRYAVAYGADAYRQMEPTYRRLLDFIREQGLEPAGGAYMEILLDELSVQDDEQYVARIEIPVKRE